MDLGGQLWFVFLPAKTHPAQALQSRPTLQTLPQASGTSLSGLVTAVGPKVRDEALGPPRVTRGPIHSPHLTDPSWPGLGAALGLVLGLLLGRWTSV